MRINRTARLMAAAVLVAVPPCAPPANAVTPPPVDNTRLPAAAPAAPARRNVQREVCTVPSWDATLRPSQLNGMELPAVWALTRGVGQRIAVIDTGVAAHQRLPSLIGGGDYVSTTDGTADCDGHGTLVAGIIAAAPDPATDGFSGVAPLATVIAIRQSSDRFAGPDGSGVGDVETLAKAVRAAADLDASVINISAVACRPAAAGLDDRALGAALAYAVEVKNSVVVAAAGNTEQGCGTGEPMIVSPAWYDDYVLTVGSVDAGGVPSDFTVASPWVDVAAPGEAVLSLGTVGDAMANAVDGSMINGTSFAAPVVSAVAALIRSRFPEWTPRQVMQRLQDTAHHPPEGRDDFVGAGVIDPLSAVTAEPSQPGPPAFGPALPASPPASAPPSSAPPDATPDAPTTGLYTAIVGIAVLLASLLAAITARAALRRESRREPRAPAPD